jgi:hypothetical protein
MKLTKPASSSMARSSQLILVFGGRDRGSGMAEVKQPMRRGDGLFLEEQRFSAGLVSALLFGVLIAWVLLVASGLIRDLMGPVLVLALLIFFALARLVIRVSPEGVDVEFQPLIRRHIPLADISSCEARVYRPIREYGGWGIRFGWKSGRAYNVRGNRGVQLRLRSGESILLGSQRADELASVIQQQMHSV